MTWPLAAGAELDVGELEFADPWRNAASTRYFCGRVVDEQGVPVAGASVEIGRCGEPLDSGRSDREVADVHGVFLAQLWNEGERPPKEAGSNVREFQVSARGFAPQKFRVESPPDLALSFCELRLSCARPLNGVLVDGKGAPLVGWRIDFHDDLEEQLATGFRDELAFVVTDFRGEFECFGMEAKRLSARAWGEHRHHDFLDVVVADGRTRLELDR